MFSFFEESSLSLLENARIATRLILAPTSSNGTPSLCNKTIAANIYVSLHVCELQGTGRSKNLGHILALNISETIKEVKTKTLSIALQKA